MPLAVDVLLPLPLAPLRWLAPFGRSAGPVGARLVVPWQGGVRVGLASGLAEVSDARALELKEAIAWLDDGPPLPEATVDWILAEAERTVAPAGLVLAGLGLAGVRAELTHHLRELDASGGPAGPWRALEQTAPEQRTTLREQGLLEERVEISVPTRRVLVPGRELDSSELDGERRRAQRSALARLEELGEVESGAELARETGVGESAVRTLVRKGALRYQERPLPPAEPWPDAAPVPWPVGVTPRPAAEQEDAHCVTGGTRAARLARLLPGLRRDLAEGKSPVVVAPERRWAQEAAGWLAGELPVAVLEADADPRRRIAWDERFAAGPAKVLMGTWPVLAAPLPRPGRLVLLEAGAESHKLRAGSRSWTPLAARGWADAHAVPLLVTDVLAGPETRALAPGPIVELPRPQVRWVLSDLGRTHAWPLGDEAVRVVRQVEARRRQALVLVPRRGFSAALGCRDCGAAVMCPNCDLALRWHARDGRLRCHQCGHDAAPPDVCDSCGGHDLEAQRAAGSEWVLRALEGVAPGLPRFRWDGDVRDDLSALERGEPGVVVGTTAVLRLAPLPVLSLLLVTQVDGALHADDFRAEERVLRTLASLQELAGERRPLGLIQTFAPQHPLLLGFASGAPEALQQVLEAMDDRRRRFGYPPYGRLARVQASARSAGDAWRALETVAARLRAAGASEEEVLGPAPAPVARVRGRALAHLLLRTANEDRRRALLSDATAGSFSGVRLRVDVDPRDIGEVLE